MFPVAPGALRQFYILRENVKSSRPGHTRGCPRPTAVRRRASRADRLGKLPHYCRECPVLFACYGECPKNRFIRTPDGEEGLNYLCEGYKHFFMHVDPKMKAMAKLLREGRFADEVMGLRQP
jgi:uncharacterized protein